MVHKNFAWLSFWKAYNKDRRHRNKRLASLGIIYVGLSSSPKTRHLAEWRVFLCVRLITIWNIYSPTWKVIRIRHHPLSEMIASHYYRCIGVFCPFSGNPKDSGLPIFYIVRPMMSRKNDCDLPLDKAACICYTITVLNRLIQIIRVWTQQRRRQFDPDKL